MQKTKITSAEIFKRVEASALTEATIKKMREGYLPVATRGAVFYFVLSDLVHINYMYQFSLEWFQKKFVDSIVYVIRQRQMSWSDTSIPITGGVRSLRRLKSVSTIQCCKLSGSETDRFNQHLSNIIEKLTSSVYKVPISESTTEIIFGYCLSYM